MDKQIKADCYWCQTLSVAFSLRDAVPRNEFLPTREKIWDTFGVCGRCGRGAIIVIKSGNQNPTKQNSPTGRFIEIIPALSVSQVPDHTPDDAANFFRQAQNNLLNKNWDAAGAMFRKVLENSLKERFPDIKGSLSQIIQKAGDSNKLTPEMVQWANRIRLDGNKAIHEEPFSPVDAHALSEFTFLMLLYLFTLPGMLRKAQDNSH